MADVADEAGVADVVDAADAVGAPGAADVVVAPAERGPTRAVPGAVVGGRAAVKLASTPVEPFEAAPLGALAEVVTVVEAAP